MTNQTNYEGCERIKLSDNTARPDLKFTELEGSTAKYALWIKKRERLYRDKLKLITAGIY